MANFAWGRARTSWLLLAATALCFVASGAAFAVPIEDYVTMQPIDVCATATQGCAPINQLPISGTTQVGQTVLTNPGTTQIGFIDSTTGINITDAIWSQIGIAVGFLPAVQYVDPSGLTLSVTSCAADGTDCQSAQFQKLSDQSAISLRQPPSPAPPLSANPTTINMFFVNKLNPPSTQPGNLYGLSWVDNNGIAISSNTLLGGTGARPDTLSHEIGHVLDLDHTTFGAGMPNNLLTAGNTRTEPTSTSNALAQLAAGTADQLLPTQQAQVLLSGFVSPIPNVATKITDPVGSSDFSVSFGQNTGRTNETLSALTLTAPAGSYLEDGTFKPLNLDGDTPGIVASPSFSNCITGSEAGACQALTVEFSGTPFGAGDDFDYSVGVCRLEREYGCQSVPLADLADALENGTYTYQFDDGYQTVSVLQSSDDGELTADSWDPDAAIQPEIYDPALLMIANEGQPPCTLIDGACPGLTLEDGFPPDEGGQPVPEPPALPILLGALGFVVILHRRAARS
jgi:hypothetical protein